MAANQDGGGGKSNRGFASMNPGRQREIASQGGRAAHQKGVAHQFTSQEARAAGRIGGQHSRGGKGARPNDADEAAMPGAMGRSGSGRHTSGQQQAQEDKGADGGGQKIGR